MFTGFGWEHITYDGRKVAEGDYISTALKSNQLIFRVLGQISILTLNNWLNY
jgi:hypothetical protein